MGRKRKKKENYAWVLVLLLSVTVFLIAAGALFRDYKTEAEEESELNALAELVKAAALETILPEDTPKPVTIEAEAETDNPDSAESVLLAEETPEPNETMIYEYSVLYQENTDLGGWVRIEGTVIDYPVMFTPDDPQKYLHLSFEGEYSSRGVPFIGEGCTILPRSDNIILYGHHMKSGAMFAAIVEYADIDFWREHPTVYFSTLYEEAEYDIFAAIETDVYSAKKLRCYTFTNAENETDFGDYLAGIRAAALYDTGVDVVYGDELVTLSTCGYHIKNGRFVIVARKQRPVGDGD